MKRKFEFLEKETDFKTAGYWKSTQSFYQVYHTPNLEYNLHFDQNEKLVMSDAEFVIALNKLSGFVTSSSTMYDAPKK